jgi:ABC-type uncharacterized transport system ATPase component
MTSTIYATVYASNVKRVDPKMAPSENMVLAGVRNQQRTFVTSAFDLPTGRYSLQVLRG